jgi:outer membrane immunogenic protein
MKTPLFGTIALMAMAAGTAVAADMPVRTPLRSAPPVVVYGWTNCYVGANGGYTWRNGRSAYQDPNPTQDPINGLGANNTIPTPTDTNGRGWVGGGQVGCNWEMDRRVVFGVEADIDAVRASGSAATVGPNGRYNYSATASQNNVVGTANEQVSLRWLSTIRARAGIPLFADRALLFLTGGLAMGGFSSSGSVNLNFTTGAGGPALAWGGSNSSTQVGYAVGGGLEYALSDRWSAKAEYLWYDLGHVSHPLNCTFVAPGIGSVCTSAFAFPTLGNTVTSVRGSIIRVGLNYRFNSWSGPIATRY